MTREELEELFYNGKGVSKEDKLAIEKRVLYRKGMIDGLLHGMKKGFFEKQALFEERQNQSVFRSMDKNSSVFLSYNDYNNTMSIEVSNLINRGYHAINEIEKAKELYFVFCTCSLLANMFMKAGVSEPIWSGCMSRLELPEINIYLRENGENKMEFSKYDNGY